MAEKQDAETISKYSSIGYDGAPVRTKDRGVSQTNIAVKDDKGMEKDALNLKLRPLTAPVCDEQLREKFNKSVSLILGFMKPFTIQKSQDYNSQTLKV